MNHVYDSDSSSVQPNAPSYSLSEAVQTDTDLEAEHLRLSRILLYQQAFSLFDQGLSGQACYETLVQFNATLQPPGDDTDLRLVLEGAGYPLGDDGLPLAEFVPPIAISFPNAQTVATPTESTAALPLTSERLHQAIADKDIKALYDCVPLLVELRMASAIDYALQKDEIKTAFGKAINLNDLERAVSAEQRRLRQQLENKKLDIADVARGWATTHRQDWGYDPRIKTWRHWNGQYWQALEPRDPGLELETIEALHDAGLDVNSNGTMDCFQRAAATHCSVIFTEGCGKVNFENGTLDLDTNTLLPFKREDYLTHCLPYCYVPGKHPTINHFLKDTIPDVHARQAFIAHLGLALMQNVSLHQSIILLGPTRAGKSTLLALANAVCGTSPSSNFAEDFSFAGPSLFSRELEGKRSRYTWSKRRLVCADEVPAEALRDEELFKRMAAHGGVEMRGMHKDEITANQWKPKIILAANDRPRYKDVAGAVKERCIFISCPNHRKRDQRDPNLFAQMRQEIEAFTSTCILLAQLVLQRGYYPLSYAMKHMQESIAREGNDVKAFLAERCFVGDATDWTTSEFVYSSYVTYCDTNGQPASARLPKNILSSMLIGMGAGITAKRGRWEGKVVCGLQGIRVRTDQELWTVTDESELRDFHDDVLLVTPQQQLTVVHGKLMVTQTASNKKEPPVEPIQAEVLTVLMAESEIVALTITTSITEEAKEEQQEGRYLPIEKENGIIPTTPTIATITAHLEPAERVDGRENEEVHIHTSLATPCCQVTDCEEQAMLHSDLSIEEEERHYGLWCARHQDRRTMMELGEQLTPAYAALQYRLPIGEQPGLTLPEGHEAWLHFARYRYAATREVIVGAERLVQGQEDHIGTSVAESA